MSKLLLVEVFGLLLVVAGVSWLLAPAWGLIVAGGAVVAACEARSESSDDGGGS